MTVSCWRGTASPGRRLADRLERIVAPGVRVAADTWVSTPNGDQEVDVLVSHGQRRVAIVFTGRYEHRAAEMHEGVKYIATTWVVFA